MSCNHLSCSPTDLKADRLTEDMKKKAFTCMYMFLYVMTGVTWMYVIEKMDRHFVVHNLKSSCVLNSIPVRALFKTYTNIF